MSFTADMGSCFLCLYADDVLSALMWIHLSNHSLCRCGSVPTVVWPSSEDWASDFRRYISRLITARVAKQLQQLGPYGSRGGLVVQPALVKPVMDLHLPPVTLRFKQRVHAQHSLPSNVSHELGTFMHNKKKVNLQTDFAVQFCWNLTHLNGIFFVCCF